MTVNKFIQKYDEWLLIGQEELKLAKKALLGDDVIIIPTVFLTQQSAEKALKAYLVAQGRPFKRTHDLINLLERCIALDQEFTALYEAALDLNPFITQCRYPDDCFYIPDISIVEASIQNAEKILEFVKQKITEIELSGERLTRKYTAKQLR